MAMTIEELIEGLRCASKVHRGERPDCLHCRWCAKEKLSDHPDITTVKPDVVDEDGEGWWLSCDGDLLMECAAEFLETIKNRTRKSMLQVAREEYKNL